MKKTLALLGIVSLMSLTACGNHANHGNEPVPGPATVSAEPEATTPVEDITTEEETSRSEAATPSDAPYTPRPRPSTGGYEAHAPTLNGVTSRGEPLDSAEERYVMGMRDKVANNETDAELVDIGYRICQHFVDATDKTDFWNRIEAESNGDHDTEIMWTYATGAASITICPEYEDTY